MSHQTLILVMTSWKSLSLSSSEYVFIHFQGVFIKTNIFPLVIRLQKAFSRSLQDVLTRTIIFVLVIRLQNISNTSFKSVFKTSSWHLQDVFKTFWRFFKTSLRRLQDVLSSCTVLVNTSSRHIWVIFKTYCEDDYLRKIGHASEKFMVSTQISQESAVFLKNFTKWLLLQYRYFCLSPLSGKM